MEWESLTTDDLEQRLVSAEALISRLRADQLNVLEEIDRRQVATADGSRSLSEWVTARLDVGPDSARTIVRTMRRTSSQPELRSNLAEGVTFDRVEALSRILDRDASDMLAWADVAGVRREAAKRARITSECEMKTSQDRFLVMQPSLDESWWKIWGGLDGHSGAIVDKVLSEACDQLPVEVTGNSSWKRATALVQSLLADEPPPGHVTVIVESRSASATSGEAGVTLESGVRVGQRALQSILCDAQTEVIARTEDGRLMNYGRKQRTAPPALRRALLAEVGYRCAVDGCDSRHRLQVHHLTPWSEGGRTDQAELTVLCWFHHHVVVHERGFEVELYPDRRRVRLRRNEVRGPPSRSEGSTSGRLRI